MGFVKFIALKLWKIAQGLLVGVLAVSALTWIITAGGLLLLCHPNNPSDFAKYALICFDIAVVIFFAYIQYKNN